MNRQRGIRVTGSRHFPFEFLMMTKELLFWNSFKSSQILGNSYKSIRQLILKLGVG